MTCHQQDQPASCEFWSLLSFTCGALECHIIIKMVLSNRRRQRVVLAAGGLKLFNLTLANCSLLGRTECDRSTVFKAQGGTVLMTQVSKEGLGYIWRGAGDGHHDHIQYGGRARPLICSQTWTKMRLLSFIIPIDVRDRVTPTPHLDSNYKYKKMKNFCLMFGFLFAWIE